MSNSIYTDGTLITKSKLDMVNICLSAIGEVPLESDTDLGTLQSGTDAAIARDLVSKTMLEVQNQGWFFNTDYNFELIPDAQDFIAVPPNMLRIDPGNTVNRNNIIIKNGKLYRVKEQEFKFDDKVKLDIIWLTDYDQLPFNAWNYIAYRSATLFEKSVVGSPDLGKAAAINEAEALQNLTREQLKTKDYNILSRVSKRGTNPSWFND